MEFVKGKNSTEKSISGELRRLFETLRPFGELPDLTIQGYIDALEDISLPEAIVMVNTAIRTKWDYLPSPGELREIVSKFREAQPPEMPRECARCGGTRFRMVNVQEGFRAAVPCECMSERGRESMKDWLRRFNPEFVSKVA